MSLHPDTTPPQPNHNVTPTRIVPEQYNHEITQQISRKLLRMDVLTSETCWALNNEIKKQVASRWSLFIQLYRCTLCARCEVLKKVLEKISVFRHDFVWTGISVPVFRKILCLHLQSSLWGNGLFFSEYPKNWYSLLLQNSSTYIPIHAASYPRRPASLSYVFKI